MLNDARTGEMEDDGGIWRDVESVKDEIEIDEESLDDERDFLEQISRDKLAVAKGEVSLSNLLDSAVGHRLQDVDSSDETALESIVEIPREISAKEILKPSITRGVRKSVLALIVLIATLLAALMTDYWSHGAVFQQSIFKHPAKTGDDLIVPLGGVVLEENNLHRIEPAQALSVERGGFQSQASICESTSEPVSSTSEGSDLGQLSNRREEQDGVRLTGSVVSSSIQDSFSTEAPRVQAFSTHEDAETELQQLSSSSNGTDEPLIFSASFNPVSGNSANIYQSLWVPLAFIAVMLLALFGLYGYSGLSKTYTQVDEAKADSSSGGDSGFLVEPTNSSSTANSHSISSDTAPHVRTPSSAAAGREEGSDTGPHKYGLRNSGPSGSRKKSARVR